MRGKGIGKPSNPNNAVFFKSGKWLKQTPTPPFWGDVGVKKWSQFFFIRAPENGHF